MTRLVILTTLLISICMPTWEKSANGQGIQTYQRRFIGDIGYAEVDRRGNPVVVMNPAACRRLGPELCSFFRAHEMAHHQLGHFNRNISVQQKEAEADRYAASMVSTAARSAAQQFFASGRGGGSQHGSSRQRLARVSGNQSVSPVTLRNATTQAATSYNAPTSERLGATRSVRRNWVRVYRVSNCSQ